MSLKMNNSLGLAFLLCTISYLFCGTASTIMSTYLPNAISELLNLPAISEAKLGEVGAYISAISLYGWMFGGIAFGVLADRFGRKKVLVLSTALYGIATVLVVFVTNWYVLLGFRFVSGMGVGGVLLLTTVYISEIWPEKSRPIILGFLAIAFPVGIVATGAITVLFSSWRDAFWLGVIPVIDAILIWILIPESPKWQRKNESEAVLPSSIFQPEYRKNLILGSVIFGAVLIGLWGIFSWLPTWVQSLLPTGQDGQKERGITMMLLGMGGIIGGSFSGFLIRSLGNRNTLILTFAGLILACGLLFLTNSTFSRILYFEIALLALFFGVSQGSLNSYIPALFPSNVRASATGFCFNIGRVFTATAVFFVGALVTFFGGFGNALLSFSGFFFFAIIATYFGNSKK